MYKRQLQQPEAAHDRGVAYSGGDFQHGFTVVGGQQLALRFPRQQVPETTRATGQVQDRRRIAGKRQRPFRHSVFQPVGEFFSVVFLEVLLRMVVGVLVLSLIHI